MGALALLQLALGLQSLILALSCPALVLSAVRATGQVRGFPSPLPALAIALPWSLVQMKHHAQARDPDVGVGSNW